MFFVTRVKYLKNGEVKKSELMSYDTLNQALAKFHTNLGTDMVDESLKGSMCTVINSHGGQEAREYWGYTDIDPEPPVTVTTIESTAASEPLPVEAEVPEESAE